MRDEATAFGPATVANLGAGFDVLGMAVRGPGDTVRARRVSSRRVVLEKISGDDGRLPMDPQLNVAGVAAAEVLRRAQADFGVSLTLWKGLGIGTGLGSSAASAAAAALATNALLERPITTLDLIGACVEAERVASGAHADNVAAAIMGGFIAVEGIEPLRVHPIPAGKELYVALVSPQIEVSTREARSVLPGHVPLAVTVRQMGRLAGFVSALISGSSDGLMGTMRDELAAVERFGLVPGAAQAVAGALAAGALGSSLSGSGPSLFALCENLEVAHRCAEVMLSALSDEGTNATHFVSQAGAEGARLL